MLLLLAIVRDYFGNILLFLTGAVLIGLPLLYFFRKQAKNDKGREVITYREALIQGLMEKYTKNRESIRSVSYSAYDSLMGAQTMELAKHFGEQVKDYVKRFYHR